MKKLTKSQAEIWDRLQHGIPEPVPDWSNIKGLNEMAKEMAMEIDKDILEQILAEFSKTHK